jgi:hypothetical protein
MRRPAVERGRSSRRRRVRARVPAGRFVLPWNLVHLGRMLKDAEGIPAPGNQRRGREAGPAAASATPITGQRPARGTGRGHPVTALRSQRLAACHSHSAQDGESSLPTFAPPSRRGRARAAVAFSSPRSRSAGPRHQQLSVRRRYQRQREEPCVRRRPASIAHRLRPLAPLGC